MRLFKFGISRADMLMTAKTYHLSNVKILQTSKTQWIIKKENSPKYWTLGEAKFRFINFQLEESKNNWWYSKIAYTMSMN